MSIELVDKGVSTEDLDAENVKEKEVQKQDSKEKEKKETIDLEKLEAVLSTLVENKVKSIRSYGKKAKEKKLLMNKFKTAVEEENPLSESQDDRRRQNSSSTLVSSCKCICHHYDRKSIVPCDAEFCQQKMLSKYLQPSIEPSEQLNLLYPQRSLETYDGSIVYKPSESICCPRKTDFNQRLDRKKLSAQKCLPKRLSTEQWLNSTSRQASTETATTSSGYISPTFGIWKNRKHSIQCEFDVIQADVLTEGSNDVDSETIIEMSKIQAQKTVVNLEGITPSGSKASSNISKNDPQQLKVNNVNSKDSGEKCDTCHVFMPQCLSTTCLPSCKYSGADERGCFNIAPSYRHLHPSGGHYVSCCNSPTHSFQFQYDENYLMLAMNLEDLEFEQEEERRKRRKRKKKRRKERQARARGLMADELKSVKHAAKQLDPEDLPKRARWTIVATACLLLLMCMLLVGVTLRMAPIIDEMVRKENEEMLNSLSRQGTIAKEAANLNATKNSTPKKMASMEERPGMQEINLMSLAIPQLNQLKNQLDQELGVFQESLETLKIAQNKLSESGESLKKITKDCLGTDILVPLSASMYVPGKIADAEHAIVDIGTGYYVQKDIEGGIDYFKRKLDFVTEQMEKIQAMGIEKSKVRDAIVEVMEIKLQAHLQSAKSADN